MAMSSLGPLPSWPQLLPIRRAIVLAPARPSWTLANLPLPWSSGPKSAREFQLLLTVGPPYYPIWPLNPSINCITSSWYTFTVFEIPRVVSIVLCRSRLICSLKKNPAEGMYVWQAKSTDAHYRSNSACLLTRTLRSCTTVSPFYR